MPKAKINGAELHYDDHHRESVSVQQENKNADESFPILFHHGFTSSRDSWAQVLPRLGTHYRCVAMDCRGAGDSEHTADGYAIEQLADDVVALADHLGFDRFHYVGHSMGGMIGMELGIRYAKRLKKLVLVCPGSASGMTFPPEIRERARRIWEQKDRAALMADRKKSLAREISQEVFEAGVERALSISEGHMDGCWDSIATFNRGEQLAEIQTPTLMIAGAADGLLNMNLRDFALLGNATLHVFSRVSHAPQREVPTAFSEVLLDFLQHGVVTAASLVRKHAKR